MKTQKLERLIREYIDGVWESNSKSINKKILEKLPLTPYNPELTDLHKGVVKNEKLAEILYRTGNSVGPEKIVGIAREKCANYQGGLALGYLFPEENFSIDKDKEFDNGIKMGQVYRLKNHTHQSRRKMTIGLGVSGLGFLLYMKTAPYFFSEENLELNNNIQSFLSKSSLGFFLYGLYPMMRYNLFNKDAYPSKKLITSAQFSVHRNPFYFGLASAISLAFSKMLSTNILSENPNWLSAGIVAAGIGFFMKGVYDYTIQDEEILEKQFGQEYVDYKNNMPRYFPNLFRLFRSKK
ncbi:MAG: hypothetical protein AABX77_03500 [Nanoarchaeota archaeon]